MLATSLSQCSEALQLQVLYAASCWSPRLPIGPQAAMIGNACSICICQHEPAPITFRPAVYTMFSQLRNAEELRRQLVTAQDALQRESNQAAEAKTALVR